MLNANIQRLWSYWGVMLGFLSWAGIRFKVIRDFLKCDQIRFIFSGVCNLGSVPIGEPLMDTSFSIDADKRLRIHGRQCAVDFKVEADSLLTEDIADIHETEENRTCIVVQGRVSY